MFHREAKLCKFPAPMGPLQVGPVNTPQLNIVAIVYNCRTHRTHTSSEERILQSESF